MLRRMDLLHAFVTCYLGLLVHSALAGLYLPKRHYNFLAPSSISSGDRIGTIYTLENSIVLCGPSKTSIRVIPHVKTMGFTISATLINGSISLAAEDVPNTITGASHFTLTLICEDIRPSKHNFIYAKTLWTSEIVIESLPAPSSFSSSSSSSAGPGSDLVSWISARLCPSNASLRYDIIENGLPGYIDTFWGADSIASINLHGYEVKISLKIGSPNLLTFYKNTSSLYLTSSLDRESNPSSTRKEVLECEIFYQGAPLSINPISRDVTINIYDVDDNAPKRTGPLKSQINSFPTNFPYFNIEVLDRDSTNVTNEKTYHVTSNDTQNVIELITTFREDTTGGQAPSSIIKTRVVRKNKTPIALPYQIHITIEDVSYKSRGIPLLGSASNKLVYIIKFYDDKANDGIKRSALEANLDINAAKYSLVAKLEKDKEAYDSVKSLQWTVYSAFPMDFKNLFNVTQQGQVFLFNDQKAIRTDFFSKPKVKIALSDEKTKREEFTIKLKIVSRGASIDKQICHQSCFPYTTEETCISACGYGALSGHCYWKRSTNTCTPNLNTCPDGTCSDLEKMNSEICPQDCDPALQIAKPTVKAEHSTVQLPCRCDNLEDGQSECRCDVLKPSHNIGSVDGQNGNGTLKQRTSSKQGGCTEECQVGIAVAIVFVVLVLAVVVRRFVCKKCLTQGHVPSLKHVNSLVSMSAIPSDYVVDDMRDARAAHANRKMAPPTSGAWTTQTAAGGIGNQELVEDEWELPRQNLTLDFIIGEGEFGQVMKATLATRDQGSDGTKVVAVKMLKPEASGAEYQDLYSEFQMLKEVDHPNVIRMLGVCTQKGPLYIVVEFCELGSLRSFLRASKFKNKESWEEKQRSGNVFTESRAIPETRVLTSRNLFSFAWQIAKGMDYLAGLKIVHRDLAARNVLVKEGMQCKISDFGLSRDVYEASIYLQETKGRIPVKWMAPEFLYAQVYTTKSDVWSFGILLWEIVTLGASPYPGIPPERLFHLLSTGYRMDRPEDCPDEMYALMQKCWKSAPEDRPSFAVLRDIIDHILQQNLDYLELPDSCTSGPFDDFQAFRRQVCREKSPRQPTPNTDAGTADKDREPTGPSTFPPQQPTYGNIQQVIKHGGHTRRDRTAPTSTSPLSSHSSSYTSGQNGPSMHWQAADEELDKESVPESSRLLREDNNSSSSSSSKHPAKNLYENNVNLNQPSNNRIAKNGQSGGTGSGQNKLSSSVFACPRQTMHENLTYV